MIKFVFPSLAVIVNSSKWGSARVSGESGLREKCIDLWINVSKPPPSPWSRFFLTVVKFWMFGVREFKVSFDSWITATLTLCRSKNSPSSTCLLPMPFALNCRMVKGSSSEALVVTGDGNGFGIGGVVGELQELHAQFLIRRYSAAFWSFEDQNTSNEANQNNDCTYSSPHDLWRCFYTRNMDTW